MHGALCRDCDSKIHTKSDSSSRSKISNLQVDCDDIGDLSFCRMACRTTERLRVNGHVWSRWDASLSRDPYIKDVWYLFFVNGFRLNCTLGLLDGLNGCAYFSGVVDEEAAVTASYFYMPTRIGLRYPMLYSLEQNKKIVVSPEVTQANLVRSYASRWSSYLQISIFFLLVMIFAVFIDRMNANRKK